ncbi:MAG: PIG-L family deacetylase [Chitinophagales bacterium]|nr:PIG-L family deacetylase [Chitinophagales bacterium]
MKKMLMVLLLVISVVFNFSYVSAQIPIQKNSAEIFQDLQRLNTLGTVLYVAAHPDDENTRLLSWLVNEKKFRTAYVSLTRGDGGQNLLGTELGTSLGVIRTQELLAARKIDGAEQYFTRAYDFGFSKNPEETLEKWNKDSVLRDLVTLIRTIKPDVMICRFPHTGEGGHGHHTASAILARKAFQLAADPQYKLPSGLPFWHVKSLFWNTFNFGSANTISESQLKLEIGNFNPVLGKSYGEIASNSRSQHKSQGFGTASTRGELKEYFVQWYGDTVKNDLFENLNFSWSRIPRTQEIQSLVNQAIEKFQLARPNEVLPLLLKVKKKIDGLKMSREFNPEKDTWLKYKTDQLNQLIFQCAGIFATATVNTNELSYGDSVQIKVDGIQRSNLPVSIKNIILGNQIFSIDSILTNNILNTFNYTITIPDNIPYSSPYWLDRDIKDNLFQPLKDRNGNQAYIYDDTLARIVLNIDGQDFQYDLPLNYRFVDPIRGEVYQQVVILPQITMQWSEPFSLHPNGDEGAVSLKVTAHSDMNKGHLLLKYPEDWNVQIVNGVELPELNKGQTYDFVLNISNQGKTLSKDFLEASIEVDGQIFNQELTSIDYSHIPRQTILKPAHLALTSFPIITHFKRIGYLEGAGDMVAMSLKQLGYEIVQINEHNYNQLNWNDLEAVVVGVRAYNTHKWLNDAYDKILEYVNSGGNLVVQYNTNNRLGPIIARMFPYDLEVTTSRVTVEEAPVTMLDKDSPILNYPNKITNEDFDAWIQERGIYFAGKRGDEWKSVIAMNDPNDTPKDGSLVYAPYGKGNIVYTGLSFFRELPSSVVGAFRLFVNLIELPKNQ